MIIAIPFQFLLVKVLLNQHAKGVKITDKRVRLTTEVLQGIRLIKAYGWEAFYAEAIAKFRKGEIKTIKKASYVVSNLKA
jgi:ATP-binding cassette subfamily C (CFTR/MRP) protein 1